ncbi:metallophosphoesterase [Lactococcus piscium]|uniref:Metallophosphoesterase n=1 Tax=Pseudolactococcus piscium TaxID=1364 RepID=A0A2A5S2Y1_9LACT|nr:metallophosphoesterase [Lactococcus piscium]PCS07811.1 metallophosphoesterase [Lactococcus piscium]
MNDLRKLERLEEEIDYLENRLKETNSEKILYEMSKTRLQEAKKQVKKLRSSLGISLVQNTITTFDGLNELFELFPENRRRPVNKIIQRGDYFNLVYNINEQKISIQKKDEIVYSTIPYDTGRNYIQRAAILTLLYPESTKEYLEIHNPNLMIYIEESLRQVGKSHTLAEKYYQEIFNQPLFMMQVLGRMLQHDERGPLSANLPGKFLYDVNLKTGITGYLVEFLKFVIAATRELPIATDGKRVTLIENFKNNELTNSIYGQVYLSNYSNLDLNLLPEKIQNEINMELMTVDNYMMDVSAPMLRSEVGSALQNVRKNYIAHSIDPRLLEPIFENVLPTHNNNLINVVSDIHSVDGHLPFQNDNFNILAGDISDSFVKDKNIKGLIAIGNHELSDVVTLRNNEKFLQFRIEFRRKVKDSIMGGKLIEGVVKKLLDSNKHEINEFLYNKQLNEFDEYRELFWFKLLFLLPDASWAYLPIGSSSFYEVIKNKLSNRFPNMTVLNNEVIYYQGIRYIGLTVPVALVKRKLEAQQFMLDYLGKQLDKDFLTPTVIVSHAPLFNELSMLSPKSKSYNPENNCSLNGFYELFGKHNIIGVVHGHHHIPASKGREKHVEFAGKRIFVVCSIYSKINTGLDLNNLIKHSNKSNQVKQPKLIQKSSPKIKKPDIPFYDGNTPIGQIQNMYREKKGNKIKFTVEKTIQGKRHKKRFDEINEAIDYLNELNKSSS